MDESACPVCFRLIGHMPDCRIDYTAISLPADYEKPFLDLLKVGNNAGSVIGAVRRALRYGETADYDRPRETLAPRNYVDRVVLSMMAGDYNHLLRVAMDVTDWEVDDDD